MASYEGDYKPKTLFMSGPNGRVYSIDVEGMREVMEAWTEDRKAAVTDMLRGVGVDRVKEARFEVWSEGAGVTVGHSTMAQLLGICEAATFSDACRKLLGGTKSFDPELLTLKGRRLFDNEADARRLFG